MTIWADADSLPREARALIGRRAGSSPGGEPLRAVFVSNRPVPLPPGRSLEAIIVGKAGASAQAIADPGASAPAGVNPGTTVGSPKPSTLDPSSADDYIMASARPGDIVVTRDIPLAARALAAGLSAINDRGTVWTVDSVRERASLRDRMAELRDLGLAPSLSSGKSYGPKEAKAFADALDKAIRAAIAQRT